MENNNNDIIKTELKNVNNNNEINEVESFQEINMHMYGQDLHNFFIFIDIDNTIIKDNDKLISKQIPKYITLWKNKGAKIIFLTHRFFSKNSVVECERLLSNNGIFLCALSDNLLDEDWKDSDNIIPIQSTLLTFENYTTKTTNLLSFSYYCRNILFSRGNLIYENKSRKLYGLEELSDQELLRRQSFNPFLTNNKGKTTKFFIEAYNKNFNNNNNNIVKHAIFIDDNFVFVQHVTENLKNNNIMTYIKGFHIKWKNIL